MRCLPKTCYIKQAKLRNICATSSSFLRNFRSSGLQAREFADHGAHEGEANKHRVPMQVTFHITALCVAGRERLYPHLWSSGGATFIP